MKLPLIRKPMFVAWLVLVAALPFSPAAHGASPGLSLAKQLNEAFVEVAEIASASVVVIQVEGKTPETEEVPWLDSLPPELRKQFEEHFGPRRAPRSPRQRAQPAPMGQGSGVVIREDGYILTNGHVVEDAKKITVRFRDGKQFTAKLQGVDPESDIAVIKIEAKGLPVAKLGDSSKTRVGEFAIAIGAPFSLDYSVTVGHVSAKGRQVLNSRELFDQDFIQTDASINPGNSGGPIVNLDGEVIGINTLIRGMNTGIGFAVPINLAKLVSDQLVSEGKFTRAWLGIGIETLADSSQFRDAVKDVDKGVVVTSILPEGPSAKSSLEPGDVIIAVDGRPVATVLDLRNEVRTKKIGGAVNLDVVRDGRKLKVKVQPGELPTDQFAVNRPSRTPADASDSQFGLKVQTVTPQLARKYGTDATSGVVVTEVEAGGIAEAAGIKAGDVITRVDRTTVRTAKEFTDALKAAGPKKGVSVVVTNEAGRRLEILKDDGN